LTNPLPDGLLARPRDYLDLLLERAPSLSARELKSLDFAMRVAGYISLPFSLVVEDVLALTQRLTPIESGAEDEALV